MACLAAKPAVDGLEREYEGRATVLRADIQTDAGRTLAARHDIDVVPSFVVLDGSGGLIYREEGTRGVPAADIRRALRETDAGAANR